MNGHAGDDQQTQPEWSPLSWKTKPIKQQPEYDDPAALEKALNKVRALPPIVHNHEVEMLKQNLARACEGKAFLLQGGDCAERFEDCTQEAIEKKFKIMLQMSLIIIHGARIPVIRLARMAGQFAKPRSAPLEMVDGVQVHSYKGDMINGFPLSERKPDPQRLVDAYFHAVSTTNYLRAMITGGVSDLSAAREWRLENVLSPEVREEYELVVQKIMDSLSFLNTIDAFSEATKSVHLFNSHEGLLLDYESALTYETKEGKYFNYGAHFLWIGDRTRELDGAHMEYFRGIANPIGVKVGPSMKPDDLVKVIHLLNPQKEPGRLTLISRYGVDNIERVLPTHIKAAQSTGIPVLWITDPCHGNTEVTPEGIKTRNIEKVMGEMEKAFKIHAANGSHLGGVHLELTGDDVTECIGGSCKFDNLSTKYESFCDPRLNYTQSLDVAFHIAKQLNDRKQNRVGTN